MVDPYAAMTMSRYHPGMQLFIQYAWQQPVFYFSWVLTVVVSIILHELAHGWAALQQGDDTPRIQKRMTPDPLVHMGGMSLIMLFVVGIAWGQMPINPYRFRSRYGEAIVAGAGPAMNVLLAWIALTTLAMAEHFNWLPTSSLGENLSMFLWVFGVANLALAMFNLIPIPPLDGSAILANFHPGFRRLLNDPDKAGIFGVAFILLFVFAGRFLFEGAIRAGNLYLGWLINLLN